MFTNVVAVSRVPEAEKQVGALGTKKRKTVVHRDLSKLSVKRPEREKGDRVRVNVSGKLFETYASTLTSREGSIFNMRGISRYFDSDRNEYYFERDSKSFEAIFTYLQCGVIDKPDKVTYKVFLEEMQFFGFGEIAQRLYNEKLSGFQKIRIPDSHLETRSGYIYHVLEYPGLNSTSRILSLLSALVILLCTSCTCIETVPWVRSGGWKETLNFIQLACVLYFSLESLTRFFTCPERKKFLKNVANIIDIVSVLPVYILLICGVRHGVYLSSVLRFLRMTRIFQAFPPPRNPRPRKRYEPKEAQDPKFLRQLNMIMMSLAASMSDLLTCCSLILFVMVLFSCLLYVIEFTMAKGSDHFSDVPKIFWFSLVTLTSLGYGDVWPLSTGKVVYKLSPHFVSRSRQIVKNVKIKIVRKSSDWKVNVCSNNFLRK